MQVGKRVSSQSSSEKQSLADGLPVLQRVAGKDASKQFWKYHNESILKKFKGQLQVGSLDTKKQAAPPTPPATPPPEEKTQKAVVKPQAAPGTVAPMPGKDVTELKESMDPFGDLVPYADPSWYQSVRLSFQSLWSQANASGSTILHTSTRATKPFVRRSALG